MNRIISLFFVVMLIMGILTGMALADEVGPGKYFTVYRKDSDSELFATSWRVSLGDKYLSSDNKMYEVVEVDAEQYKAYARFVEDVKLPEVDEIFVQQTFSVAQDNRKVALYCTHSAESYVPTDGSDSKPGKGGIFEVGNAFKKALEKNGVMTVLDRTSHEPHDANAYVRSRRTAAKLLKDQPDAVFDLHRDAIPKEHYITEIKGTPVSKIRIVLGRRNQNIKANEELAIKLKAVADKMYPGLIRDIYYARGNYNQDMAPRALLFEFGTHEHTRERAENSATMFADVVAKTLYGGETGQGTRVKAEQPSSEGSSSGILWLLAIAGLGGLGFLFLSSGGREFRSKARNFAKKEFGSFLARRNRNKR